MEVVTNDKQMERGSYGWDAKEWIRGKNYILKSITLCSMQLLKVA